MRSIIILSLMLIGCSSSSQQQSGFNKNITEPMVVTTGSVCTPETCYPPKKEVIQSQVEQPKTPQISVEKKMCPNDMTFINGNFCDKIEEHCIDWLDNPSLPYARCKKYAKSICAGKKVHMNYCIDTEEMHDETGLPYGDKNWLECKALCEKQEKRLCNEPEWTFACMGEELHPYPYGSGYEFDTTSCNIEKKPLLDNRGKLYDHRQKITEFPLCVSQWGVHNLVGSVDEMVEVPRYNHSQTPGFTMRSALKGGHFLGGRHRCLPKTTDHDETFKNPPTVGCRCCSSNK